MRAVVLVVAAAFQEINALRAPARVPAPTRRHSAPPSLYEEAERALTNRGVEEGAMMGDDVEALAPSGDAATALADHGVARVDGVLDADGAAELRSFVDDELARAERDAASGAVPAGCRFADVLLKANRRDLLMPLEDPRVLSAAVAVARSAVGDAVAAVLGDAATLYECSALVSDPGAPRQVIHPDVPQHASGVAPVVSCFCALQDVSPEMGPTLFLPGTSGADAHGAFFDTGPVKDALLRGAEKRYGLLGAGDVSVFDGRTLHAGTANASPESRRALFYMTFKHPDVGDPGNPPSIRPCYAGGGLALRDLRGGAGLAKKVGALAEGDARPPAPRKKKKPKRARGFG